MANIRMDTQFKLARTSQARSDDISGQGSLPLRVVVLGNFSGRSESLSADLVEIASKTACRIDKDNFDEVFEAFGVCAPIGHDLGAVEFSDIDDFHPDNLIERLDIFSEIRLVANKIKKAHRYEDALDLAAKIGLKIMGAVTDAPKESDTTEAYSIDDILSISSQSVEPEEYYKTVIRESVKNLSEPKQDARISDILDQVWSLAALLLRKILSAPAVRELEALWRSLERVNRALDTDRAVVLSVVDITDSELRAGLEQGDEKSAVFAMLSGSNKSQVNDTNDIVLVASSQLVKELSTVACLAKLGECLDTQVYLSSDLSVFGCDDLFNQPQSGMWGSEETLAEHPAFTRWSELAQTSAAQHLSFFAPSYLYRLPYGSQKPIEFFNFEEFEGEALASLFPWGNGAFMALILTVQEASGNASNKVNHLPFYVTKDYTGQTAVQPSSAVVFSDTTVAYLRRVGVNALLGNVAEPSLQLASLVSLADAQLS